VDGFGHADARNIYLIGRSPHGNEKSRLGLQSSIAKPAKQASKVMESHPDGLLHGDPGPQKPDSAAGVAKQTAPHRVQEGPAVVPGASVQRPN
jgi:hypothetical protein